MFYYLSVIGFLITPPNQGVVENSVTGSFADLAACRAYQKQVEETVSQIPGTVILQSECRTKDKDKGRAS